MNIPHVLYGVIESLLESSAWPAIRAVAPHVARLACGAAIAAARYEDAPTRAACAAWATS